MRTILGAVVTAGAMACVGAVTPAAAQTIDTPALPVVGRVELGVNGSGFFGADIGAVAAGPLMTVNFSRRDAIQVGVDVRSGRSRGIWRAEGPYLFAYRRTFSDLPNGRVFVLIGAAGWMSADTHFDAGAPRVAMVGIGAEGHVASRMILQGQFVLGGTIEAVLMRVSAALVVPLGRVER